MVPPDQPARRPVACSSARGARVAATAVATGAFREVRHAFSLAARSQYGPSSPPHRPLLRRVPRRRARMRSRARRWRARALAARNGSTPRRTYVAKKLGQSLFTAHVIKHMSSWPMTYLLRPCAWDSFARTGPTGGRLYTRQVTQLMVPPSQQRHSLAAAGRRLSPPIRMYLQSRARHGRNHACARTHTIKQHQAKAATLHLFTTMIVRALPEASVEMINADARTACCLLPQIER